MLVEHFLRSGYYDSAIGLAQSAGIEDLTNINLFLVAKDVEEALTRQDTSKCLAWSHDNKSKLRKMKSTLEFNVRLQEFIELIKRRCRHIGGEIRSSRQELLISPPVCGLIRPPS